MPYGCRAGGRLLGGAIIAGFFAGATGAERPASSCSLCLSIELDVRKSSIFAAASSPSRNPCKLSDVQLRTRGGRVNEPLSRGIT